MLLASYGAEVTAVDKSNRRLSRLEENFDRVSIDIMPEIWQHDWLTDNWEHSVDYDLALVDAPCSGSGIIGKHPEIRMRRSQDDLIALKVAQKRVLIEASKQVKKGGLLAYVVCSILKAEGQDVVSVLPSEEWEGIHEWSTKPPADGEDGFQMYVFRRLV